MLSMRLTTVQRIAKTVLFWCNNDSVNIILMRKCAHPKNQSLHTCISNTAKLVELRGSNFYCEHCESISRRLPLLQIRNVPFPFHILSPNAITNIMRLGMSLIARPSSKVSNYLAIIYERRETLDSTERRQTAEVRQRTRERCDDVISLPSGFILSLLRTSRPSEHGTGLELWDSVKQRGVRLMQQSRQTGRQHRTACIKSHLKTLTCRPPRRLTVEEQRVWNIHLTFL